MAQFQYKAKSGPERIVDGTVDAEDLDRAIQQIIKQGFSPIDVFLIQEGVQSTEGNLLARFEFLKRVALKDVVEFTRQMSDMIEASVPVLRSLSIVASQTSNPYFKVMIEKMHDMVRDGAALSTALAEYPKVFSLLYINLVKTGEVSGKLEVVFERLASYLEKENDTRAKVQSSLAYPALVLIVSILTVFVLLTFVVPRLSVVFEDLGQELPLPTVILLGISDVFSAYWWLMILVFCGVGLYISRWLNTVGGRLWADNLILKIPIIGKFLQTVEVGRFSLTLATLVETGIVITTALNSVWRTIQNVVLQNEIRQVSEDVTNGMSLRKALENSKFFPTMAVNMISVGEETGKLDKSLYKIADKYEREADQQVKLMLSLLGPIVLIFIVGFVGFVVIALLLPIFQMNLVIQ